MNEAGKEFENLPEAIIKVVAFFDMFDCPLTLMEVWRFCDMKCELSEIENILSENRIKEIETKNGYYFLAGRGDIYYTRISRYNFAARKFKRAVKVARLFKIIPWIKMIGVGNMIGANNAKDESDIDLFIISEKNRVWITRLFTAGLMALLRLRPQENNSRDKICLSFFVSEEAMDLRGLMIFSKPTPSLPFGQREGEEPTPSLLASQAQRSGPFRQGEPHPNPLLGKERGKNKDDRDVYFKYWLSNLVPVYDPEGYYKKLIDSNDWLREFLPNWEGYVPAHLRDAGKSFSYFYHDIIDLLIGGLEPNLMNWEIKRFPSNLKELMNKDSRVMANTSVIKLHSKDRREEYALKLKNKLENISNFRDFDNISLDLGSRSGMTIKEKYF